MRRPDASFTWAKATASTTDAAPGRSKDNGPCQSCSASTASASISTATNRTRLRGEAKPERGYVHRGRGRGEGMAEMSDKLKEKGGEIYLPAE